MSSRISALATDSTPDRASDYLPTYDASASGNKKILIGDAGALMFAGGCAAFNPADATTYYMGPRNYSTPSTSSPSSIWIVPRPGTIKWVSIRIQGAGGTTEQSSIYLRKNSTTDELISSTFTTNADGANSYSVNLSVTTNDYIEVKWVTPTWSTNPTGLIFDVSFYMT